MRICLIDWWVDTIRARFCSPLWHLRQRPVRGTRRRPCPGDSPAAFGSDVILWSHRSRPCPLSRGYCRLAGCFRCCDRAAVYEVGPVSAHCD